MTKQHYAKIAAAIAAEKMTYGNTGSGEDAVNYGSETCRRHIAFSLAAALRGTNPNYDEARFLAACEVEP